MASTQDEVSHDSTNPINSKLFLETSMPTSASPYPSPSSAFYPPPIPASHEFANKIANNKRYRGGVASLVTGGTSPSSQSNPGLGIDSLLSAGGSNSEPASRRASDAFLGASPSTSSRRGSDALKAAMGLGGSQPGSRRSSREVSSNLNQESIVNGTSSKRQSGNPNPLPETKEEIIKEEEPAPVPEEPAPVSTAPLEPEPAEQPLQSPSMPPTEDQTQPSPLSKRASLILTPLTPSRPAPPSPAPSRRPSLNRRGSSRYSNASRDGHNAGGGTPEKGEKGDRTSRRQSTLSMTFTYLSGEASHLEEPEEETAAKTPRTKTPAGERAEEGVVTKPIIVRDFAYPEDDERFSKVPIELLPKDQRPTSTVEPEEEEEYDDDDDHEDWRDLRYEPNEEGELTPLPDQSHQYDNAGVAGGGGEGEEGEEVPLRPGIYRALYAFEAEGTAEMSLAEGDLVRVVGNGGIGWAVVERGWKPPSDMEGTVNIDGGDEKEKKDRLRDSGSGALGLAGQALVPESYLEVWELDEWLED